MWAWGIYSQGGNRMSDDRQARALVHLIARRATLRQIGLLCTMLRRSAWKRPAEQETVGNDE